MKRATNYFKLPMKGIVAATLTIMTASWIADGIKGDILFNWIPVIREYRLSTNIFVSLLFFVSFIWLYNERQSFFAVRGLSQYKCNPHTCLILLVSTPNILPQNFSFPLAIKEAIIKGDSLEGDIASLNKVRWNWQQLLRGILPHKSKIKRIYLIGSSDSGNTKGSHHSLEDCELLIKNYLPCIQIDKASKPVDFEDFDELVDIINETIKNLKQDRFSEKDIIIDVTGGQKTTSIACAAVTLNKRVTFQYVQTNEPYNVLVYDFDIHSPVQI